MQRIFKEIGKVWKIGKSGKIEDDPIQNMKICVFHESDLLGLYFQIEVTPALPEEVDDDLVGDPFDDGEEGEAELPPRRVGREESVGK